MMIADQGTEKTIKDLNESGATVACGNGCDACCRNASVQLTQPELQGISWYASEQLAGDLRVKVRRRLEHHRETPECPFLVEHSCAIYPVRPLACRQFLVKSTPCAVGEDVSISRPSDIVRKPRSNAKKVAVQLLKFWNFHSEKARVKAFENGFIFEAGRMMHDYPWEMIARTMDHFDALAEK